ncbi:ABC transporter ATP-binding protein [Corynebacterium ammoniagenes]|uniref:ABC transporter ATP-binding protein n=2 Tax=Corynebacterium ammoniagenes TaxID=1697 RepID=A0AAV5GBN6_CORAM|nr:ABC transporter ATP-binding protein [Corynebacterium ammoniagenes]AQS72637.1 ABC transporter ATP-binding protein [Corynebacterium ammoniagenes]EFG81911.1 ABC transporter, ATP-binding protein [Corynebacterium ammoniagenes DSM 20306]GJN43715.1 ABC transporter ATP-binding protein [Corynebacterium ammoniagenes]
MTKPAQSKPVIRQADALAPASAKDIWGFITSLPSAPKRYQVIFTLISIVIAAVAMNIGATVIGSIVDLISGGTSAFLGSGRDAVSLAMIIFAIALVVETVGRALNLFLINTATRRLSIDLRKTALDAVMRAPVPRILELGTGNVITRLSKDIDTTVSTISHTGDRLIVTLVFIPVTAVTLVLMHPAYLLVMLATGVIMWPWIKQVIRDVPVVTNVVSAVEAKRNNVLLDSIRALETLRQFRLMRWAHRRMDYVSWETVQSWGDRIPLFNRIMGQGSIAFGFLLLGSLVISMPMVAADWLSVGEAAAAVLLVMRLEMHVFTLLFSAGDIQHALTALGRAVALGKIADDDISTSANLPAVASQPSVVIDKLSYAYPGGAHVLSDVSVTLKAGTTTALVGTSGAGKSTLAALVAGLQYPTAGKIIVDGTDTATVPNVWISQHVALITQDVHLFSGTVRNDLLLAKPDANDNELLTALATVGLRHGTPAWDRWLPKGLNTEIGAGNPDVGAEVAQQLSLARMFLRQPPVLIMDEATSEAGSEHAEALESAARAVARGRTTLVVAHRLDQAREADRILVMEAGEIIEDGDHESLIALGGHYARSYAQWEHGTR